MSCWNSISSFETVESAAKNIFNTCQLLFRTNRMNPYVKTLTSLLTLNSGIHDKYDFCLEMLGKLYLGEFKNKNQFDLDTSKTDVIFVTLFQL